MDKTILLMADLKDVKQHNHKKNYTLRPMKITIFHLEIQLI